jgi:carbon-monoxide dehydrogenase iron sulfur subunit
MPKILKIDYSKCHGCGICETVCKLNNSLNYNGSKAKIKSISIELEGWGLPKICMQCNDPACMAVCPNKAIYRDEALNRVMVDHDRCIGCRLCVMTCPFGAPQFDNDSGRIVKCDLCDGDPVCVRYCMYDALQYVEADSITETQEDVLVKSIRELMSNVKEPGSDDEKPKTLDLTKSG